ncbi:MAG TPA: ABC transporter transmembrane domain-containing protein [Bryobacteraceae bacterium]|nr:ABC transporter transmembrane domain-containing protein [Bryobacteraceae bacterium]
MKELYRLLRYARPYTPALLASIILMAIVGASQGLLIKIIPVIFDRVLQPHTSDAPVVLLYFPPLDKRLLLSSIVPPGVHNIWTMVACGILLCFIAKGICDYLGNYLINLVGLSAIMDLRQAVFDQVLRQDAHFFENQTTGRIMSSIMNDAEKIQVAVSTMLADWLRQLFTLVALLIAMVTIDWRLSLISLGIFPVVGGLTAKLGRRIRRTTRYAQDRAADLNQILQESITGHNVVKSFGAEDFESNRFHLTNRKLRSGNLRYIAQQALASPLIELFGAMTIVLLLSYARIQVKAGSMSAGSFTTFVIALLMVYEPIKRLTGIHNIFQQALGASVRVFEYLDYRQGIVEKLTPLRLSKFEKEIRFENVSFSYPAAPDRAILHDINLTVKYGEVVAIVGPSGAGKSTLASLVPRFYDVTAGAITLDGKDVRDLRLSNLRDKISIVAQDTFLFNDTIFNNIAYGRPYAREEDVLSAAKTALADEFILSLDNGYQTVIGERGLKLSGGQRQRIAIARALLKNAPILILDEATSQLDTGSERLVQIALAALMQHRTVIVIAHRLSTIRRANKIVVIDAGRIAEAGSHDELMAAHGIYQKLHELQHVDAGAEA